MMIDFTAYTMSSRGTGSVFDVVTDCQAMPAPIDAEDFPEDFLAHSGMVEAARRIYRRLLVSDNILNKALTRCPDDYGIVVTGHSLGSGIAAVLGFLLRQDVFLEPFWGETFATTPGLDKFTDSPRYSWLLVDFFREVEKK